MPLTMLSSGEGAAIKRIGGRDEAKRFLENLGFTVGEKVKIEQQWECDCPGERFPGCGKQGNRE